MNTPIEPSETRDRETASPASEDVVDLKAVEAAVMQDWRWGNLTKLGVANHLKRGGFRMEVAIDKANALASPTPRDTLVETLREISDLDGEINPSNYDHDDACYLNRQFCYAITIAAAALKEAQP